MPFALAVLGGAALLLGVTLGACPVPFTCLGALMGTATLRTAFSSCRVVANPLTTSSSTTARSFGFALRSYLQIATLGA